MSMTTETERTQQLAELPAESNGKGIAAAGPIHLAACLGAGGLVALAITLIEWLA